MKSIFLILTIFASFSAIAGEWITLTPENYNGFQIAQANNSANQPEGLYVSFKSSFSTTSTCTRKDFVVITDPKLADRALSTLMFAQATAKSLKFYVDSTTLCAYQGPVATMVTAIP
ncbi:MAG TPA: hypothetical protein VIM59_05520 [Cellvibrio sp.]